MGSSVKPSKHPVEETLERHKRALEAKGVTVFALVDHSGEAERVELKMRPTKLIIFGADRAGHDNRHSIGCDICSDSGCQYPRRQY